MADIKVRIDPAVKIGEFKPFWKKVLGCGSAFLLTRKDLTGHVEMARDTIGFEYLRFHGILSDDVGLVQFAGKEDKEIDPECLNFINVDAVFDTLLDIGIKPFVELGFMPRYLASGDTQVFKYPSNVTPPASYELWKSLVSQLVSHWKERYGIDELLDWYFEVWNEPNLKNFWTGTQAEYFKLYDHSARAIKAVDVRLKVGGPASSDGKWIAPFLDHCHAQGVPVDFVSTHVYQCDQPLHGKEFLSGDYARDVVARVRGEIEGSPFPAAELHFTEWGSTTNPFDPLHDTSSQAAFICKTIASVNGLVDSFSYWTVSDVFEELGLPDKAFHGGFGLITINGIRKPSFNAYYFLEQLGTEICELKHDGAGLPQGIGFLATRAVGELRLLAWYFVEPRTDDPPGAIDLAVRVEKTAEFQGKGLDFAIWEVSESRANAYEAWNRMGSPRCPTVEQIEDLKQLAEVDEEETGHAAATQDEEHLTIQIH
ncbi:MAG: hypothetical protein JW839_22915, partial [Candidatus Lokiarchaeota archaeon]|nr:hypothetical protein [Candidatus Lokiarchaeota archaeon]